MLRRVRWITRTRLGLICVAASAVIAFGTLTAAANPAESTGTKAADTATKAADTATPAHHMVVTCGLWSAKLAIQCPDVYNPLQTYGYYVGHDEPGVWFYSHVPGSGNRAEWTVTMPKDPPPDATPGAKTYAFENHIAFWFGMDLCATQSFPELLSTCTPDSDSNIADPKVSAQHAGSAFLELQFYPPGWAPLPTGTSCDATHWCAALNIWSLLENPVNGKQLNSACQAKVGGTATDNFAFVQLNGVPTGPPNPLDSTTATFTPNAETFLMNQGDKVTVRISDSHGGLAVKLIDHDTRQTGTMVASAANGFGQIVYTPDPSTECAMQPYTFRPMYSTSTPETRATWTAYPYNVAFADETGHFDFCGSADTSTGTCAGSEGPPGDQEEADSDDTSCFAASQSTLDPVSGCIAPNYGFDGTPYQNDWPDGSPSRGTPLMFTSALTGRHYNLNYPQVALAGSQPQIEAGGGNQNCDVTGDGAGCTYLPVTDDGTPAKFYPYFYTTRVDGCTWGEGADFPGLTVNDFGQLAQYGQLGTGVYYTGTGGKPYTLITNYLNIFRYNPCPVPTHRHRH